MGSGAHAPLTLLAKQSGMLVYLGGWPGSGRGMFWRRDLTTSKGFETPVATKLAAIVALNLPQPAHALLARQSTHTCALSTCSKDF